MTADDTHRRPRAVDVVVSVVSTLIAVGLFLSFPVLSEGDPDAAALTALTPGTALWWVVIASLVAQGVATIWATRSSTVALLAAAAIAFAIAFATPAAVYGVSSVTVLVMIYRAVVDLPIVRLSWVLATAGILVAAGGTVNGIGGESLSPADAVTGAIVQAAAVVAIPLLVGLLVRSKNDVRAARRDEQQARTGQRDAQIQVAVARERTAMARELHDIAAHHLSGIALMAAVVDRQIDSAPEEAHSGVQQVRAQATAVLDDLRRLVGLLRDDGDGERSVETLAAVPELVDRARLHGPIELSVVNGVGRDLGTGIGPLAQLALYRTIQEGLTNSSTHAPGAARLVEIDDRNNARVVVTVSNAPPTGAGPSSSGGFGLVGMRERAELVGAELRYGRTSEGGWQIRASVHRESTSRSPSALTNHTRDAV